MKTFFIFVVVMVILTIAGYVIKARSEEAKPPLTVGEVVAITAAIASLDSHPSGSVDGRGNPVMVPNDFHFPGAARMTLALDVARGREVTKVLNEQAQDLRVKMVGSGKDVPKEKMDEFTKRVAELEAAQANVVLGHVSVLDLCLDVAPPRCQVRNEIPLATLGGMAPIVDQ